MTGGSGSRPIVESLSRVLAGVVLLLAVLGAAPSAAADAPPPTPAPGHPWFGPALDISEDGPLRYADRLGAGASLYTFPVDYPLTTQGTTQLRGFAEEVASQGAVLVLQVEPVVALGDLTPADADELAALVAGLHRDLDTYTLVRFAPEMNGSWRTWGQQPRAFVRAFRAVATAVHAATDHASMVWSPVYGSGYPFGRRQGTDSEIDLSERRETGRLDTDGNGRLEAGDDPYGPYYPGAGAVDWVGLFLYRFGQSQGVDENVAPPADEVASRLAESWGYGARGARASFYERFAEGRAHPLLLETAALYNPGVGGAGELGLKRTWWRQVLAALPGHPLIGGVSWLELDRVEAEVDDQPVDWQATRTPRLAGALLADLRSAGLPVGEPVTRVHQQRERSAATAEQAAANATIVQARLPPVDQVDSAPGWTALGAGLLALVLLLGALAGRLAPSWRYAPVPEERDLRLDLFRGWLILAVVVAQIEVGGLLSRVTLNGVGAITGAEAFLALSGVVLAMSHRTVAERGGEWVAAGRRWRRARTLYLTALVLTLGIYLLGRIPGLDATAVTTFTDRGTGAGGPAARGRVHDLYVHAERLLDYPPPWYAVRELLLLRMGPWVLSVLGLFVVLTAIAPVLTWLLRRRLWWVVLALSGGGYAYARFQDPHWPPAQFEAVYPLLVWQVPFLLGLVIGHHRDELVRALTTRAGKLACGAVVVAHAGLLTLQWLAARGLAWAPLAPETYARLFDRAGLPPGRLLSLVVLLVVAFAFLTTCWKPVHAALGRLLVPLGQASLYVFVMHAFVVIAVANVPGLDRASAWQGVVVQVLAVALLWVLVKRRFLFSVVPR